jgi:S-(hydroxymethyl)glutathione dehydrogenase/alcohol dehydrogenase
VPPRNSKISIDPFKVHCLRKLVGSCGGGTFPDRDIPSYLGLYTSGKLKIDELISKEVTLAQINDGIDMMLFHKIGRCVVKIT